jgi:hypothetical protein
VSEECVCVCVCVCGFIKTRAELYKSNKAFGFSL